MKAKQLMRHLTKPAVCVIALAPLTRLAFDLARGSLIDPVAEMENRLGFWALALLLATLACTPIKRLSGLSWPLRVRRMLGLFAFAYATIHLSIYVFLDQGLDLAAIFEDVSKRKFITAGALAFVLLVPLAVTSTKGWLVRLGTRRWRTLHRLVYAAAILGALHFFWRVKADYAEPVAFTALLAVLLVLRLVPTSTTRFARVRGHAATERRGESLLARR